MAMPASALASSHPTTLDGVSLGIAMYCATRGLLSGTLGLLVGFSIVSAQRRAESERAWTSMARELAHQLGTPISSLQGWLEVLRLPPGERPGDVEDDVDAGHCGFNGGKIANVAADDFDTDG